MKIITNEQYSRLFEGIENYIEGRLDWRTKNLLIKSFREAYNGLLGKAIDEKEYRRFKMSCITRYLEMMEQDKVIKRIIIFKYTREDSLIITFENKIKEIFKKGITLEEMVGY